jgi:predicted transcriptional regulator
MYLGNLSFELLRKYLEMLVSYGMIQLNGEHRPLYVATEKGRQFLKEFRELGQYTEMAENKKRLLERYLTLTPEAT